MIKRYRYVTLMNVGIHIGHSFENSLYESGWMVYAFRKKILIINLFEFITMFRIGFDIIDHTVARRKPIWFINLDASFDKYTRIAAEKCGEFSSTRYWIKGMLSNFTEIAKSFRKMSRSSLFIKNRKNLLFDINYKRWIFTRYSWPRAVFISSIERSYFAAKEANSFHIPSLGIVDTTTDAQASSLAVPGNDDSLECIVFYNNIVAGYILYKKFTSVVIWFSRIRKSKRLLDFTTWISNKIHNKSLQHVNFAPLNVNNHVTSNILNNAALKFFSSKSIWLDQIKNQLYIFRKTLDKIDVTNKLLVKLDSVQKKTRNLNYYYSIRKASKHFSWIALKNFWKANKKMNPFKLKKLVKRSLLRLEDFPGYVLKHRKLKKYLSAYKSNFNFFKFIRLVIFSYFASNKLGFYNILNFFNFFNNIKKKVYLLYSLSMFNKSSKYTFSINIPYSETVLTKSYLVRNDNKHSFLDLNSSIFNLNLKKKKSNLNSRMLNYFISSEVIPSPKISLINRNLTIFLHTLTNNVFGYTNFDNIVYNNVIGERLAFVKKAKTKSSNQSNKRLKKMKYHSSYAKFKKNY